MPAEPRTKALANLEASLDREMQRIVKRRGKAFLLPVLVLVLVGVGTVAAVALTSAPSVTAGAISQALGRRVEIGAIDVRPGFGLEVEVADVRVYADAEPRAGELPMVEARRALGRQSWLRLLIGQFVPLDWELDAPIVRIDLAGAGEDASPSFPLQALVARNAKVEVQTGTFGMLELSALDVEARRRTLLPGVTGRLSTQVKGMGTALGRVEASFDVVDDQISVSGTLAGLALSRLPRLVPAMEGVKLGGTAGGQVEIGLRRDSIRASIDLGLKGVSLLLPNFEGPLQPQVTRVNLGVEWRAGVWTFKASPIKVDEIEAQATASLDTKPGGRLRAELALGPMQVGEATRGKFTALSFMGKRYESWRGFDRNLEMGRFVDNRFTLDIAPKDLGATLTYKRAPAVGELYLHTRLEGGRYRTQAAEDATLEDMTGELELIGNQLKISDLRMRRGAGALPNINIALDGFAHFITLPGETRRVPTGPETSLSGIGPAFRALSRSEAEKQKDGIGDFALRFSNLQLAYPAFILPAHGARGRMRFPTGKLVIEDTKAIVGGGPAELDVTWAFDPAKIEVSLRFAADGETQAKDFGSTWLAADLEMERVPLGDWVLADVTSHVESKSGSGMLVFEGVDAKFDGGKFRAQGRVDIAKESVAPLRFELAFDDADATGVTKGLGFENMKLTGKTKASGNLAGRLDPAASFLRTCDLSLGLEFRDGKLENVPAALQLARLPSLQGIRGLFGRPLSYESITTQLQLHAGKLQIEELAIQSSDIRVLASGDVDLNSPQREADMLVALLFLRTLDGVIERVPVVGDMLLGEDKSLVTMSFNMRGPVTSPSFTPATPATLQGAAQFLRRLRGFIPGLRPTAPEPAPQPEVEQLREAESPDGAAIPDAASPPPLGDADAQ